MLKKITLALLLATLLACTTKVNTFHHEPSIAATNAAQFAQIAFVQQNSERAYDLLADEMKNSTSLQEFKEGISKLHPSKYPLKIEATEYEPRPGQKGMSIFLYGENEDEKFYYEFVMDGVKEEGYKVSGIWRGNGPYPPSTMRKPL
jgi:hypothetical protein